MMSRNNSPVSNEEIKAILMDRVDRAKQSVGMVIGLIEGSRTHIVSYGNFGIECEQPVSGDTLFEIGSVTKVFTAVLLADMHLKGEINITDPISSFLPESVKTPTYDGEEINLESLVKHRSGLPRMPNNLIPQNSDQPLAEYSNAEMYEFLSTYKLTQPVGEQYEYSNIGYALLGHILELRSGISYNRLVKTRICEPLEMAGTSAHLDLEIRDRLAIGHNHGMEPVSPCRFSAFEGAGAIRSSANDMVRFIAANFGSDTMPIKQALQETLSRHSDGSNHSHGFGWVRTDEFNVPIYWHNGGTNGFHSFLGIRRDTQTGIVVLSNTVNFIDDIGFHLLENQYPLTEIDAPKVREAVQLDKQVLRDYVGDYQLTPEISIQISLEGGRLLARLTGQPAQPLFPETESEFFFKVVDAQLKFMRDKAGHIIQLKLLQMGTVHTAERI